MKLLIVTSLVWFAFLWLLFILRDPLIDIFFILYLPVHWGLFAAGCVIAAISFVTIYRNWQQGTFSLTVCIIGIILFFTIGFDSGRYVLFQIRKPDYENQLNRANSTGRVDKGSGHTETGPPKLHAFYWQRGIIDNWSGVVYDPTGRIERINDSNGWDEVQDHELAGLFGGLYYRCQNVGDGWYICWFT